MASAAKFRAWSNPEYLHYGGYSHFERQGAKVSQRETDREGVTREIESRRAGEKRQERGRSRARERHRDSEREREAARDSEAGQCVCTSVFSLSLTVQCARCLSACVQHQHDPNPKVREHASAYSRLRTGAARTRHDDRAHVARQLALRREQYKGACLCVFVTGVYMCA